jgi:hypothetical protein
MTQRDHDRLVALKKARKGRITQRQAAEEIGQSERHVRRLTGPPQGQRRLGSGACSARTWSNRKLDEETKQKALEILDRDVYRGFGPTLAAEYLDSKHEIHAGRETVRTWMIEGKLWRASRQRVDKIHQWRPRRSRVDELVQWDAKRACRASLGESHQRDSLPCKRTKLFHERPLRKRVGCEAIDVVIGESRPVVAKYSPFASLPLKTHGWRGNDWE